jgi:hypothetical protein
MSLLRPLIKKAYKECKAPNIYCTVFAQGKGQQIFVVQYLHKNFVIPYLCEDTLFWNGHSECSWIYQWQPGALQQLQGTNVDDWTSVAASTHRAAGSWCMKIQGVSK